MANNKSDAAAAVARLDALAGVRLLANVPEAGFNVERFAAQPLLTAVHFGDWAMIASARDALPRHAFLSAVVHFARGMAAARGHGRDGSSGVTDGSSGVAAAEAELRRLLELIQGLAPATYGPLCQAAEIYSYVLRAAILVSASDLAGAIRALRQASSLEDALPYDEPPLLFAPVRPQLEALVPATRDESVPLPRSGAYLLLGDEDPPQSADVSTWKLAAVAAVCVLFAAAYFIVGKCMPKTYTSKYNPPARKQRIVEFGKMELR